MLAYFKEEVVNYTTNSTYTQLSSAKEINDRSYTQVIYNILENELGKGPYQLIFVKKVSFLLFFCASVDTADTADTADTVFNILTFLFLCLLLL